MDNRLLHKFNEERKVRKDKGLIVASENPFLAKTKACFFPNEFSQKANGLFEIVIVRPTVVFEAFLISQLGKNNSPCFKLLETDCTAYLIKKYSDENETIDEIQHHYIQMFRHEICRWLGKEARNSIEKSFFDFFCCFKLEFHSHLILLEPSTAEAKQIVQLRPRISLLNWWRKMKKKENPELAYLMDKVSLSNLTENATLLLKNFSNLKELKLFLQTYYKPLFATAMSRIGVKTNQLPNLSSIYDFRHYFSVQIHTQLISYVV